MCAVYFNIKEGEGWNVGMVVECNVVNFSIIFFYTTHNHSNRYAWLSIRINNITGRFVPFCDHSEIEI